MKFNCLSSLAVILCGMLCFAASSCGGGNKVDTAELERIKAERDSIANLHAIAGSELNSLNSYINSVSECLDSVWGQEGQFVTTKDPETGGRLSRNEMRRRIIEFSKIIDRQRSRLAQLTDSLKQTDAESRSVEQLTAMIEYLSQQLKAKEGQMEKLQAELADSRRNIAQLETAITAANETNTALTAENKTLDTMVAAQ